MKRKVARLSSKRERFKKQKILEPCRIRATSVRISMLRFAVETPRLSVLTLNMIYKSKYRIGLGGVASPSHRGVRGDHIKGGVVSERGR